MRSISQCSVQRIGVKDETRKRKEIRIAKLSFYLKERLAEHIAGYCCVRVYLPVRSLTI